MEKAEADDQRIYIPLSIIVVIYIIKIKINIKIKIDDLINT